MKNNNLRFTSDRREVSRPVRFFLLQSALLVLGLVLSSSVAMAQNSGQGDREGLSNDLQLAIQTLNDGDHSVAIVNGNYIVVSDKGGVFPLLDALADGSSTLKGSSVADKVIGKAAALLMVKGGIKELHTRLISRPGIEVLERYNVPYQAEQVVDQILNRNRTDLCPMEKLCAEIEDPEEAYQAITALVASGFGS